jgi:hypothetical protein
MLTQQPQRLSGLGQNPDRFGAADIDGIVIAVPGEDVGDPVDGGFEPDRIPSRSPGNDQLQAMLTAAAQPHKPFLRSSSGLLFGTVGVGLIDRRLQQGLQWFQDTATNEGAIRASTVAVCSAVTPTPDRSGQHLSPPTASGRAARVITARSDAKPMRTGLDPALQ